MSDPFFSKERKCAALNREIQMRQRAYPKWVQDCRMSQEKADQEIAVMKAILADYQEPDLFAENRGADDSLRVVMVTASLMADIESEDGVELPDEPTVVLCGSIDALKHAARTFGEPVILVPSKARAGGFNDGPTT